MAEPQNIFSYPKDLVPLKMAYRPQKDYSGEHGLIAAKLLSRKLFFKSARSLSVEVRMPSFGPCTLMLKVLNF
jgi:hypothetical protein